MQLIQTMVFAFLLLNVLADSLFIPAYSGYKICSGPEALTRKVFLSPKKRPCDVDGTLAFDISHHLSNRILGRNRDEHVNMVQHQLAFQYIALPLSSQFPEDLAQILRSCWNKTFRRYFGIHTT